jgi:hypothetical protein
MSRDLRLTVILEVKIEWLTIFVSCGWGNNVALSVYVLRGISWDLVGSRGIPWDLIS